MCNTCIHKIVCSKYIATGGVKNCEHFKEERKGLWIIDRSFMPFISTCSECGAIYDVDGAFDWNYCPNCGADLRGIENG